MSFEEDFMARATRRLVPVENLPETEEHDVTNGFVPPKDDPTPAAVLVPIVLRGEGLTVLLTQRTSTMPTHAGQIAFPGGRIQPEDEGAVGAALRETFEETGIASRFIEPVGGFGRFRTGTNFLVTPVVAYLSPDFTLAPDPCEVAEVFETPLAWLMDAANHERHTCEFGDRTYEYNAMPWNDRYIWGMTATVLKALHARLYEDPE
jgi:8-oxo-dGTP pyrophosphatase MutT (NUDIX family)